MERREPRLVTVRQFRNNFQRLDEPVRVIRARGEVEILGTWTPWEKEENGSSLRAGHNRQRGEQSG
jgi:hypothetical protein